MIPRLYPATSTSWETNGSPLAKATVCSVKQGGGSSELTLVCPMDGLHFKDIKQRSIIMMKPDPYTREQPFRIYYVGKPISGMVTFRARHLAYDTAGIPVAPIEAFSAKDAANKIKANNGRLPLHLELQHERCRQRAANKNARQCSRSHTGEQKHMARRFRWRSDL